MARIHKVLPVSEKSQLNERLRDWECPPPCILPRCLQALLALNRVNTLVSEADKPATITLPLKQVCNEKLGHLFRASPGE